MQDQCELRGGVRMGQGGGCGGPLVLPLSLATASQCQAGQHGIATCDARANCVLQQSVLLAALGAGARRPRERHQHHCHVVVAAL